MRRPRSPLQWVGLAVATVCALILAAMAYGSYDSARELAQHPPPGRLIDVGGHRLHLNCTGQGGPTVVLESGGGSWSLDWSLVQPPASERSRVCVYDRAGLGWSEPGPLPRDAQQMVQELHTLLASSGEPGPYLMVGHSLGGHVVRLYATRYPTEVAGAVLVDARHEDFDAQVPEYRQAGLGQLDMVRALAWLSRLGLLNLVGQFVGPPAFLDKLPAEVIPAYLSVGFQAKYFDAIIHENEGIARGDAQVRAAGSFGDLPLVVIVRGLPDAPPGLAPSIVERGEAHHRQLQATLAASSTVSTLVVAERSSHGVMLDQPEVIVSVIGDLVTRLRR